MIKLDNLQSRYSFYCDENFPEPSRKYLRKNGFKAIHSNDVGNNQNSDLKQFQYAKSKGLILITNDFDFVSFNNKVSSLKDTGIVLFESANPPNTNKLINKLIKHIKKTNIQLLGHITTVSPTKISQR